MEAHTATAKRKRSSADEVSDAEVEEFYAILCRMREASRRLCSGAGVRAPAWCPSFSWEDFEPTAPAAPTPAHRQQPDENATPPPRRQPCCSIDLNAEPEPEPEPPVAAPATPRPERASA